MKKIVLVLLITLAAVSAVAADTIHLRNGTAVRGTVLGFINGRFAIRLTTSATLPVSSPNNRNQTGTSASTRVVNAGSVIFLRPREIDRIEIDGRSIDEARYQTRTVEVALAPDWIDSGIDLKRGERVRIDATGTIYAGRTRISPAGLSTMDPNSPLPSAPEGKLIAMALQNNPVDSFGGNRGGEPRITEIGAGGEFVAERDGRLYLTPNRGNYADARGAFSVQIKKEVDLAAMARTADEDRNDNTYDPFALPGESAGGPAPSRSRQPGGNPNRDRRNRTLERIIEVQGNAARGVDTGIDLRTGDQVTISATGNVTAGRRAGVVSPDGGRASAGAVFGATMYPVPTAGVGALIGFIEQANGQRTPAFLIGSQLAFAASADGRLFLMVNDDNYSDNSGSFSARIVYPENR